MEISREFGLVVQCCRCAFDRGGEPEIPGDLDWPQLLGLARFHRVQGLVWWCLSKRQDKIPAGVAEQLAADATHIAAASLRATVECRDLFASFDRAKIPCLFIKGLTLGALAYGNAALKAAADIDLLICESQVVDAAQLLKERGYRLAEPNGSADQKRIRAWHRRHKESGWTLSDLHIDLHSRLSDNRRLIPSIGLGSPIQQVEVSTGIQLMTLATEELFAYLCVHGASSAWFRLKWIADFAGLLAPQAPVEIERLYDGSQRLGAGRAADQALLLADALFGSLAGSNLKPRLNRDRASRWLAASAFHQLVGNTSCREPTEILFGTARIHLSQLPLMPGLRFPVGELGRQIGDVALRRGNG